MPTTPTPKNYDVTHIQQGPGDLWVIGTPPSDSVAPILTLASDGSPDATAYPNAVHLGGVDSATTVVVTPKIEDIKIDQFDGPVARYLTDLELSMEAELVQLDPKLMQNVMTYATFSTQVSPGFNLLTFGGMGIAATGPCIACISQKRTAPGKFVVVMFFSAHGTLGLSTSLGRAKKSVYKAQFKALVDPTRTLGRTTGVIYETL